MAIGGITFRDPRDGMIGVIHREIGPMMFSALMDSRNQDRPELAELLENDGGVHVRYYMREPGRIEIIRD